MRYWTGYYSEPAHSGVIRICSRYYFQRIDWSTVSFGHRSNLRFQPPIQRREFYYIYPHWTLIRYGGTVGTSGLVGIGLKYLAFDVTPGSLLERP